MESTIEPPAQIKDAGVGGKSIVVTGGSTGIGRAIARLLAEQGANVLICGRDQTDLDTAIREMPDGRVTGVSVDLAEREGINTLFTKADDTFDQIDALVCNAALPAEGVAETDEDTIDYVVRTNLLAYMLCVRKTLDRMLKAGRGHIVFIGSMSADIRDQDESVYAATKSGISAFAESLRKEVNEKGIKVSLIQPGSVGSDMQPKREEHAANARKQKMLVAEDIASCVLFCLAQPPRCDVVLMDVRPHLQTI